MGDNKQREYLIPSPELIEKSSDDLIPVLYHFVVLDAKDDYYEEEEEVPGNCNYLQILIENDKNASLIYCIEAQFEYDHDTSTRVKYRYETSDNEVKRIFRMFTLGVVPKLDGWEDVTAQVLYGLPRERRIGCGEEDEDYGKRGGNL